MVVIEDGHMCESSLAEKRLDDASGKECADCSDKSAEIARYH